MATYLKHPPATPPAVPAEVRATVATILGEVESEGTAAVRRWSEELDGWNPPSFRVPADEIERAVASLEPGLAGDLAFAQEQVRRFAQAQRDSLVDLELTTLPGVVLGQRHIPVGAVGSYSPGGRYPLVASAIMTVVTPKVAGVPRVVACAPPARGTGIHAPQLAAMATSGADEVLCLGGVQALAAMAFGLDDEGIAPVDMLVGAGNAYVAEAKRQLFGRVGIDLLAGPTEILVIADATADPRLVAADLLGQAEHGPNSPAILLTTSESLGRAVMAEVEAWLAGSWPTADVAGAAWRDHGTVVVCDDDDEIARVSDGYAPEHLEVHTADADRWLHRLRNYGTLFLGAQSTVVYSDKAIGLNHVLPTAGAARYTGGLWVGKFLKTVTWQRVDAEGTRRVAPAAAAIADAEHMAGHALTARIRLEALGAAEGDRR